MKLVHIESVPFWAHWVGYRNLRLMFQDVYKYNEQ